MGNMIYDSRNRDPRTKRVVARPRTSGDEVAAAASTLSITNAALQERRQASNPLNWDLRGTAYYPDLSVSGLGAYRMLKGKPVAGKALTVRITDGAAALKAGTAGIATEL